MTAINEKNHKINKISTKRIICNYFSSKSFGLNLFSYLIFIGNVHIMHHRHNLIESLWIHLIQHQLGIVTILGKTLREFIFYKIHHISKFPLFKMSQFFVKLLLIMISWGLVLILLK